MILNFRFFVYILVPLCICGVRVQTNIFIYLCVDWRSFLTFPVLKRRPEFPWGRNENTTESIRINPYLNWNMFCTDTYHKRIINCTAWCSVVWMRLCYVKTTMIYKIVRSIVYILQLFELFVSLFNSSVQSNYIELIHMWSADSNQYFHIFMCRLSLHRTFRTSVSHQLYTLHIINLYIYTITPYTYTHTFFSNIWYSNTSLSHFWRTHLGNHVVRRYTKNSEIHHCK